MSKSKANIPKCNFKILFESFLSLNPCRRTLSISYENITKIHQSSKETLSNKNSFFRSKKPAQAVLEYFKIVHATSSEKEAREWAKIFIGFVQNVKKLMIFQWKVEFFRLDKIVALERVDFGFFERIANAFRNFWLQIRPKSTPRNTEENIPMMTQKPEVVQDPETKIEASNLPEIREIFLDKDMKISQLDDEETKASSSEIQWNFRAKCLYSKRY